MQTRQGMSRRRIVCCCLHGFQKCVRSTFQHFGCSSKRQEGEELSNLISVDLDISELDESCGNYEDISCQDQFSICVNPASRTTEAESATLIDVFSENGHSLPRSQAKPETSNISVETSSNETTDVKDIKVFAESNFAPSSLEEYLVYEGCLSPGQNAKCVFWVPGIENSVNASANDGLNRTQRLSSVDLSDGLPFVEDTSDPDVIKWTNTPEFENNSRRYKATECISRSTENRSVYISNDNSVQLHGEELLFTSRLMTYISENSTLAIKSTEPFHNASKNASLVQTKRQRREVLPFNTILNISNPLIISFLNLFISFNNSIYDLASSATFRWYALPKMRYLKTEKKIYDNNVSVKAYHTRNETADNERILKFSVTVQNVSEETAKVLESNSESEANCAQCSADEVAQNRFGFAAYQKILPKPETNRLKSLDTNDTMEIETRSNENHLATLESNSNSKTEDRTNGSVFYNESFNTEAEKLCNLSFGNASNLEINGISVDGGTTNTKLSLEGSSIPDSNEGSRVSPTRRGASWLTISRLRSLFTLGEMDMDVS